MTPSAARSVSLNDSPIVCWFKHGLAVALIALVAGSAGCRSPADTAQAGLLLNADQEFAAMAEKNGAPAAYAAFLAADAVELPPDLPAVAGITAISDRRRAVAPNQLHWRPQRAEVSRDGSLGWTWGEWTITSPGDAIAPLRRGKYVHVWRRRPNGMWIVVGDIGNTAYQEPAPAAKQQTPGRDDDEQPAE